MKEKGGGRGRQVKTKLRRLKDIGKNWQGRAKREYVGKHVSKIHRKEEVKTKFARLEKICEKRGPKATRKHARESEKSAKNTSMKEEEEEEEGGGEKKGDMTRQNAGKVCIKKNQTLQKNMKEPWGRRRDGAQHDKRR